MYMLIGELVETAEHYPSEQSLPYFAGVFALRSCVVLTHPLHPMYTKINKFLHKGPAWNLDKMPSYWADRILLHPPTEDDGYCTEVEWLLDFLVDGLRTPRVCLRLVYIPLFVLTNSQDMEVYRRSNIFERLLTLRASASLPSSCSEKIVHLLYRCTYVNGGTTWITRCGLLSWVQNELALNTRTPAQRFLLRSLVKRVYESSDVNKVDDWSGGGATKLIANAGIEIAVV